MGGSPVIASVLKAMRQPGLVALMFGFRLLVALTIAWPLSKVLSPAWVMSQPQRDRSLFEPGSELLSRLVSENREVILHLLRVDIWILVIAIIIGTVPSTYVLNALRAAGNSSVSAGWRAMLRNLPRQVGIVVSYWVAVIAAAFLVKLLVPVVPALVYPWFGEKGADVALASLAGLLALTIITLRLLCDLTRACAIQSPASMTAICRTVLSDLGRRLSFWMKLATCWALFIVAVPLLVESLVPTCSNSAIFGLGAVIIRQGAILTLCIVQLGWWAFVVDIAPVTSRQKEVVRP